MQNETLDLVQAPQTWAHFIKRLWRMEHDDPLRSGWLHF